MRIDRNSRFSCLDLAASDDLDTSRPCWPLFALSSRDWVSRVMLRLTVGVSSHSINDTWAI